MEMALCVHEGYAIFLVSSGVASWSYAKNAKLLGLTNLPVADMVFKVLYITVSLLAWPANEKETTEKEDGVEEGHMLLGPERGSSGVL